jgi:hypothetical protein
MSTRKLPLNRKGQIYYGPRTFAEIRKLINETHLTAAKAYALMRDNGFSGVAKQIKSYYDLD